MAFRLARRLGDRFRFVFACLDDVGVLGGELRAAGVRVELLGRRTGLDLGCARRLAAFVRTEQVDLIHAHQYTPFAYSMLAGLVRRRPPVLFNEHGRFFPDRRSWKRVWFNRLMLRRRDRVVAVGGAVRQALVANEGISAARIEVIYNGVELPAGMPEPGERIAVRDELGLAADEFVLLQIARLDAIKDHATAVGTMARVAAVEPRARLMIVGDGPERGRIEAEIQRRGMGGWVRMLGERHDVARLLSGADAFLLTSVSEGIPVTIIEAMGAGLPVVATDVGGVGEVVEQAVTGLLAPAGAEQQLAEAVLRLAGDQQVCAAMGAAGRRRAEAMFTEQQMHAAYARVYGEVLGVRY